jgi:drug/metabolite transporter (DMT)-like permease
MSPAAVLVAITSATGFAVASVLQQRAAKQEKPYGTFDPRLLVRLLRRPLWLGSWLPDLAASGLQALALRLGPLALVQPILVTGLFLAVPLEAALERHRPHPTDLAAVGLGAFGLAVFLSAVEPRAGVTNPSQLAWLGVGLGCGAVIGVCLLLARGASGTRRGTLLGAATGVLYAVVAALLKAVITRLTTDPVALLADWHLYALAAVGLAGLLLNQNAFQEGPLTAPLTALTLVDPVVSVVIAVTTFHEQLSVNPPRVVIGALALLAMAYGVWMTSARRQ